MMEHTVFAVALLGILAMVVDVIPVVNVVTDVVRAATDLGSTPSWWTFALKAGETVVFLQLMVPWAEKFTKSTEYTWDDGLVAKGKMILAFSLEILTALGAADPQLGRRIEAITGSRRTRR